MAAVYILCFILILTVQGTSATTEGTDTSTTEPEATPYSTVTSSTDPCLTPTILNDDGGRSTECSLFYDTCDRYIIEDWYRVKLQSTGEDLLMPTSCVSMNRCGTTYPIWMNGTYPSMADDIVDIKICVSNFKSCCDVSYTTKVKNCGSFTVFYLKKAQGCNWRYCFGTRNFQCASPKTSITRTSEPTIGLRRIPDDRIDKLTIVTAILATIVIICILAFCLLLIIKKCKQPKVGDFNFMQIPPKITTCK